MMLSHTKKNIVVLSVLTTVGIVLGYFENLFLPISMLPGIKVGISNIVILYILIHISRKSAFFCGIIKAVVTGMFSGGSAIIYSVSGIIISLLFMCASFKLYEKSVLSEIGLSILGSCGFNLGQTFAACFMLSSFAPVYYLPFMLAFSVFSGTVTGLVCYVISKRINVMN